MPSTSTVRGKAKAWVIAKSIQSRALKNVTGTSVGVCDTERALAKALSWELRDR